MPETVSDQLIDCLEQVSRLSPLIAEHAAQSEQEAQLSSAVAEAFHDAGLFRMLLPIDMGGSGLTLPESLRVIEATARVDGSTGWNLAICSGGPIFGSFIAKEAFEKIFSDPRAVVAGSLNPTAQAVRCDGGWRFSGKTTYASGCAQANWASASAMVFKDGAPQFVDGVPLMRIGLFPMSNCKILSTWSVSGMRGTGSNDFLFNDVFVPDDFTYYSLTPKATWQRGAFATIPLPLQLGNGLVAVALGVVRHAIDAFVELAQGKVPAASRSLLRERPLAQIQLAQAEGLWRAARAYMYETAEEAWRQGEAQTEFDLGARALGRLAPVTALRLALQAVDLIYDAAGITSIQTSFPIERCWRDAHTISQHVILSTARFEIVGRILLGLDPGALII